MELSAITGVSHQKKRKKKEKYEKTKQSIQHHVAENSKRGRMIPERPPEILLYPDYDRPTSRECREVRDRLMALHGFPKEFEEYRRVSDVGASFSGDSGTVPAKNEPLSDLGSGDSGGNGVRISVLDGLISILLSQNTTDLNSRRAFLSLKSAFPSWEDVHTAEPKSIEDAIRCGGLAHTKAYRIKNILKILLEKKGKFCMEYLRELPVGKSKAELLQFNGLGPKMVLCCVNYANRIMASDGFIHCQ